MIAVETVCDPDVGHLTEDDGDCPICRRGEPLDTVYSTKSSWVTMPQLTPLHGHVCLVIRPHIRDLGELDGDAVMTVLRELTAISNALASATGAAALRYELNDTTLPHLHLHIYPRDIDESSESARWQRFEQVPADNEFGRYADLRDRMVTVLGRDIG